MADELKCRTVRVDSLEPYKVLARISRKPYASFVTLLMISGYLFIVSESKVFPIALAIGCLFMIFVVKDKILLDAADRFIVVYDTKNKDLGTIVYLSEIENWEYIFKSSTEEVIFYLDDGVEIHCPLVMTRKFMRYLKDKMEHKEIKREKKWKK
ncbi:MAG: hypothetical protein IJO78_01680 [Erysipelotrichaceae bacterium]|nr:hypothetical protein [Erysipelotrichaceae bacterium]MBQ9840284.1 hypothetical protein [Erysipelotrichaceae bacterium]